MAPSVLLDPEAPTSFHPTSQKSSTTRKYDTGGVSLEAQAPTSNSFPSLSSASASSPSVNSSVQNGGGNGATGSAGARPHLDGTAFFTSQTLLEQSRNFATGSQAVDGPAKPNILYIMADQMAAPLLKMNDPNSPIKTPNLDELAKTGVVFGSAYCNSPLCAPSRFTMCTGQLPSKIGGYDNASILGPEEPTYAHYLRREGYETVLAGKMHFIGPDQLHGFEHR
jgi:hypothetical protein